MKARRKGILDDTGIKSFKKKKTKKQITHGSDKIMYVGLDVHKETIQVAVLDGGGTLQSNMKIKNNHAEIRKTFAMIPRDSKYVLESSSVWYGLYRFLTDTLGLNVIVSNPFSTKVIATSLKKTDKVDAQALANLLRGGYIAQCHVPDNDIVELRHLARHRNKLVKTRTVMKNSIHGILLQNGIKTKSGGFGSGHVRELRKLRNYRIDSFLDSIAFLDGQIYKMDVKTRRIVKRDQNISLLTTVPGIGYYSALAIYSEIGNIERFSDSHKLCAYAGIVPSVRNSAETVHHGRITKRGSRMLRWIAVEAIQTHTRHAPDSDITRFYNRLAKKRGRSKAKVAAASKLIRVIYWMLKEKKEYVAQK